MAIDPESARLSAQARQIALVMAGTMLLWMGAQWLGGELGLPESYVFIFDFAALAAFLWSLFATWQIWRKRRGE